MIKRLFVLLAVAGMAVILIPFVSGNGAGDALNNVAATYVEDAPRDLGTMNIVTAVIVTYRGLDTLGEVLVLFIATAGVGFLLKKRREGDPVQPPSEILSTGGMILMPLIVLFGIYVFSHGHLTPGGGFQGGVIIATAFLLAMLSARRLPIYSGLLTWIESVSGFAYLAVGVLGLVLAGGFLDSRLLPAGRYGSLLSSGTIPLIYTFIGLKVGTELVSILDKLRSNQ
ncbi:sodium:proton antiporter [bacterium]|nr:sodium:proton antiporter [bacterium]